MQRSLRPRWVSYGVVLASVGLSLGLTLAIPALRERGSLLLFLGAVALSTSYGGWRCGLLAMALSAVLAACFVLPPQQSLWIENTEDSARLVLYVLVAGLIALLHAARERAERLLVQSEQRLTRALEAARMGVWEADLKSGEFWWSAGLEEIFGRPPGSFSGTYEAFIGYIHPEDRDFVDRAVTRTAAVGKEFEIEHRIVRPDNTIRWINTRGRMYFSEQGQCDRMLAVVTDITEQKTQAGPLKAVC